MRTIIKLLIMGMLSCAAVSAQALLNIELTRWANNAIPIATAPFAGQSDATAPDNIASVISNDLKNSGRFTPVAKDKMPASPATPAAINYSQWQDSGADYLVVGQVQAVGGQYRVNVALTNVFGSGKGKKAAGGDQHVLFNEQYTVPAQDMRALAHHVSDEIYQRLLNERGYFSTKIAYVSVNRTGKTAQNELIVADADGFNPRSLLTSSEPIMSPAWSPNGKQLAYVSFEKGHPQIFVQDVASGARHPITDFQGINGAPSWSPDGQRLAIVLSKSGVPKIYVVNADGGGLNQVTEGFSIDTEPDWSPNGRSLVFTSNRGGTPQLYQLDLASKSVQRLTYNGTYNARGQYTPDGKNIVMLHRDTGGDFVIAEQDLQNGVLRLLTRSPLDESPSIAPNGSMVLYSTSSGGRLMLGMVSTDGRVKCQLPAKSGDVQSPAWSPFLT